MLRLPNITASILIAATAGILSAKPDDKEITLTPSKPNQSVEFDPALFPGETVNLTIHIKDGEANGKKFALEGNPKVDIQNEQSLWTRKGDQNSKIKFEFEALNVGHENEKLSVSVAATWKTASSGGGGSAAPEKIQGLATGTAYTKRHVFTWEYEEQLDFADGESFISFTVSASENGAFYDLAAYEVEGPQGWNLTQRADLHIHGKVSTEIASKGQLGIHYNNILQGTSPDEIAFANFDLAIAKHGNSDNLAEDRLPHNQVANPPHEMNPGAIVIAPIASEKEGEANLTLGKRTKLTIKGNSPAIAGGTYILSASDNLAKIKIYDAEEGGEPIKLPRTFSSTELDEPVTLYVGSDAFKMEDDPQAGELNLKFQIKLISTSNEYVLEDKLRANAMTLEVLPDYDRNGMIDNEDRNKATDETPHFMWVNDDGDLLEDPHFGDVPDSLADQGDIQVNGRRDLLDFFPIELRIRNLLKLFPAKDYSYKITHPEGAFNYVELPDIQPNSHPDTNGAGSYLSNPDVGDEAIMKGLKSTDEDRAVELDDDYLAAIGDGKGVILIESTKETDIEPFITITDRISEKVLVKIPWVLKLRSRAVMQYIWQVNIKNAADGKEIPPAIPPSNEEFLKSRKDRWFFFCHGYNVDETAARGWHAEMFKRMHHKGSNARFVGVTWEGNRGQLGGSLTYDKVFTPDYWRNVYNAFSSSHALKTAVHELTKGAKSKTVISGHSMGNMLVSSAICDHGLQAEQYFLLNAAVAREAYNPSHVEDDRERVANPKWKNYPTYLWSTDWYLLFKDNGKKVDGRSKLTWRGRFGDLTSKTKPHNYYSSTEDVLADGQGKDPNVVDLVVRGKWAWIKQEMGKGLATKAAVTGIGNGNWTSNGGWDFNKKYKNFDPIKFKISSAHLRKEPFFEPFTKLRLLNGGADPDSRNGVDLSGPDGDKHANEYSIRAWLLSHDIPALSNPTGVKPIDTWRGSNTDMNGLKPEGAGDWKHSDIKNSDMHIVEKFFVKIVENGKLK